MEQLQQENRQLLKHSNSWPAKDRDPVSLDIAAAVTVVTVLSHLNLLNLRKLKYCNK
jgi:hypothetical protein